MHPQERETKSQRKERERAEAKSIKAQKLKDQQIRRAVLVGIGGLLGLGAISAVATLSEGSPIRVTPTAVPTPTDIVDQEVRRLGIRRSQEEYDLWFQNGHRQARTPIPLERINLSDAINITRATIKLMKQSENPYFKESALTVSKHESASQLFFTVTPNFPSIPRRFMNTRAVVMRGDRFGTEVQISAYSLINDFDAVSFSIGLTHEVEHVKNIFATDNPTLPTQERFNFQTQRNLDPIEAIKEEGRGYGKQAFAYIYQRGLMGFSDRSSQEYEMAVELIKAGSDVANPRWLNYLALNIGLQPLPTQKP